MYEINFRTTASLWRNCWSRILHFFYLFGLLLWEVIFCGELYIMSFAIAVPQLKIIWISPASCRPPITDRYPAIVRQNPWIFSNVGQLVWRCPSMYITIKFLANVLNLYTCRCVYFHVVYLFRFHSQILTLRYRVWLRWKRIHFVIVTIP